MRTPLIKSAIRNPEYLHILGPLGTLAYGSDQEWYPALWQRRAGCGPTTASNLMLYFLQRQERRPIDQEQAVLLMQQMWKLITPGIMGVHLLSQFTRGVDVFLPQIPLSLSAQSLKIAKAKEKRPSLAQVVEFLVSSFEADSPVAFLNLSKGSVTNLDEWHWVTLVGIEQEGEGQPLFATLFDASQEWKIDLGLWLESTTRGGGFVSYRPSVG